MDRDQRPKSYSFVFIPPHSGKSFTVRVPVSVIKGIFYTLCVFALLFLGSIFVAFDSNLQLAHYRLLKQQSLSQEMTLSSQQARIEKLQDDFSLLLEREHQIRYLLRDMSVPQESYSSKKKTSLKAINFSKRFDELSEPDMNPVEIAHSRLDFLEYAFGDTSNTLRSLQLSVKEYQRRFSHTPSIRPIFAAIRSGFGSRFHPIYHRFKTHQGIDFAAWTGAPIKATADGYVEFAGWNPSYGFVVMINHGYGYRTVYAHCSRLLTSKGKTVKKGQVIAQVGSTGLSTGPHLHYEVRRQKAPVNPALYLNLDLQSAIERIW